MRPSRIAVAACVAQIWIAVAWMGSAPLQALRGRDVASDAVTATAADRAAAPFAVRRDRDGRLRRAYFPAAGGVAGDPATRARALVAALHGAPVELACVAVRNSPSGTHVRFEQRAGGHAVHGAEAVVSFDGERQATVVASDLEAAPPAAAATPRLDAAAAIERAFAHVGARAALAPPEARPIWRRRDTSWMLEQRVRFAAATPSGDWEVWIDVGTGAVREVADRTVYARPGAAATGATGTARVFRPDPVLALGDAHLGDGDDADGAVPAAAYATVALHDLALPQQGWYRLRGPWAEVRDWEPPWVAPDSAPSPDFVRSRVHPGFEDAMAYHHLDAVQRWYQELGFGDANHRAQIIDPHGLNGLDNSKFVPTLHRISCGEGGVDDAEDAAVLVHEYGHATQYDIVPTWGTGGHAGAMGEGFGDYLANSYAWALFPARVRDWNGVFQWDGHNEFWPGRRALDTTMHYPEDAGGAVHRAGTLWCSALTDALYTLGDRRVMDTLVLDHHYALTGGATMADAANAILASDVAIYAGAHLGVLVETFARWGLVDGNAWQPLVVEATPLDIAAATAAAPALEARVVTQTGTVTAVVAHVRAGASDVVSFGLESQGDHRWAAPLALPGGAHIDLEYWLEARDTHGHTVCCPASGAAAPFHVAFGLYADRFETDAGWTVGAPGDAATTGLWTRVTPVGTAAQPPSDHTAAGSACFVTANAAPGAPPTDADVDGGATTLVSPIWDLRGARAATLSYWRWYSNDLARQVPDDAFAVAVSNDAGQTWVEVERAEMAALEWRRVAIDLVAHLGTLDRVRVRFVASDTGAGSVVEAAVDDVLMQAEVATDAVGLPAACGFVVPNPWRAGAPIRFALARPGPTQLEVFDVRGRIVRCVWSGALAGGAHALAWDGRDGGGARAAHGVYLVRLRTPDGIAMRKLAVVAD